MWSDVLYLFQDGVILTIIGLILWYQSPQEEELDVMTEGHRTPYQLLRDVQPIIEDLYRSVDDLECYQIQEYVKILREQYLAPLESKRDDIIKRFGMEVAAEIVNLQFPMVKESSIVFILLLWMVIMTRLSSVQKKPMPCFKRYF